MGETRTLVDGKKITYTGLISIRGLYKLIDDWLDEHGYGPYEDDHKEEVFEDGKQIIISINGEKKVSDFARLEWHVDLTFTNCQETIIKQAEQKVRMHKGTVEVKTDVYLTTDYDKSYEQKAFQYFLSVVIDKFVFKSYIGKAASQASKDYRLFDKKVKSFLNMETF